MIKTSLHRATSSYQPLTKDKGKASFPKTEQPVQPNREYTSPETLELQGYKQPKPGAMIENVMAAQLAGMSDRPSTKDEDFGNQLRAPRPSQLGSMVIQPKLIVGRPPSLSVGELGNQLRAPRPSQLGSMGIENASAELDAIAKERVSETEGGSEVQLQADSSQETSSAPIQEKVAETVNKTGLPDRLKTGIENLSGYSMDDVKVHYNSEKPSQLQAHAYAQGTDIHVAPGQEKHLPHEAWHVVQQKQGRVKPTMQMKGKVNINDDAGLETEADIMGQKSFQFVDNRPKTITQRKLQKIANNSSLGNLNNRLIIQRQIDDNTHLDNIDLSKYKLASSGRSGNPVLLGEKWVYKLINPKREDEYNLESSSAIEMSAQGIPVLFYKALGIRNITLPDRTISKSAVIMMRRGEGKTFMLPKPGHTKSFLNEVSHKYGQNKVQLKNLRRTFDLASNYGLQDPQFIYDAELNHVHFMDTHSGGVPGGGHCRDVVDGLDHMLAQL
ncbi:DUF4157 domain-containing protein [Okeania sp. SIO1I7]|uniref:eCIS core domain-containing protein n=1 Tax=Okeania sp. SIO1I7 TaxID=2607772 RepID=UPI0025F9613D|nr:DUF4157 domain-containing protein [Okeania sp. SIO1I7]